MFMNYFAVSDEQTCEIQVDGDVVTLNGERMRVDWESISAETASLFVNNKSYQVVFNKQGDEWHILVEGEAHVVTVLDELSYRVAQARQSAQAAGGPAVVKSPMPGVILSVLVAEGDAVEKEDKLVILESMKMENELKAPKAGIVKRVHTAVGDSAEKGQALITIGDPSN